MNWKKKRADIVTRPPWFSAFAGGMAPRREQRLDLLTLRILAWYKREWNEGGNPRELRQNDVQS